MDDAVAMEVFDTEGELVSQFTHAVLTEVEISSLEVVEEVRARHVVESNVVVLAALEEVHQVDDVGVLTHLEHLDFTTLLEHLNMRHVLLFHLLNRHFFARLLVLAQLHQAKLTLAQCLVKSVELEDI